MWKLWEAIKACDKPQYKWRHSWKEKPGNDFVGFDGARQIGRIFQVDEPKVYGKWFWIVHTEGEAKVNWPTAGYEDFPAYAACRVEMVYENIRKGERRAVAD
ncbi:hypothetical protein [Rhizobium rhizogenes]|uniref:hypothetical protein n=1 Tax=Rhizobium rhizogenes TaxID=359 RepID=UPI001571B131|nr:hypothetical protein [Rhizobium rhizogenes]NTF69359.1 hypothetical protein [Rhizobium rhizogenes]